MSATIKTQPVQITIINANGTIGTAHVDAVVHGAWAAHERLTVPGQYVATHLPSGLAVPRWFQSLAEASAVAREIDDLPFAAQADHRAIERKRKHILAICNDHGGQMTGGPKRPKDFSLPERSQ